MGNHRGGGKRDVPPVESAKRELEEETGYRADHWLQLFAASASPGLTDSIAPGFVAWGLHKGDPKPDLGEQITQRQVPFGIALKWHFPARLPIWEASLPYCRGRSIPQGQTAGRPYEGS
jgi:hypothetical protein